MNRVEKIILAVAMFCAGLAAGTLITYYAVGGLLDESKIKVIFVPVCPSELRYL